MLGSCCKSSFIREALMFRHPKYYKELRKLRNKSDQAISDEASTEATSVHPGPGHKQQASSSKLEAASDKQQAPGNKLK